MPHVMFCYGAQVVRVEVDAELGTVAVRDVVAIHDVGQVINRDGVEGQIEGGVVMGIGYALYENVALKENARWVDSFTEYLLPTTKDVPPHIESVILEVPELSGPYGAKGVAEMSTVPTAPAIANAVFNATGIRVRAIPIRPEVLAGIQPGSG
jgi:CO/xanthine dehydrogenase Mo-binding subunit